MKVRTRIEAGSCGFHADVRATCEDGQWVTLDIATDCPNISALAARLREHGPVDVYTEIDRRRPGVLEEAAAECLAAVCVGCIVPAGLSKTIQTAAGLLLPAEAVVHVEVE